MTGEEDSTIGQQCPDCSLWIQPTSRLLLPASPPGSDTSALPATSSPRSSPTPSNSGTRPKQMPPPNVQQSKPDPSGASTSGTTPQAQATKSHNLRQRSKVDYKDLNTGASQFGRAEYQETNLILF